MSAKKSSRRNVKRKPAKKSFSFKPLLRVLKLTLVMSSIAGMLSVSVYYGGQAVKQFLAKPIASIVVNGQFAYLAKDEVSALISENIQKSFIRENLDSMRQNLEANPWVDNVNLRRQWPDILHVTIEEQKPIARWGKKGFVNYRGELIHVEDRGFIEHLPILRGNDGSAMLVMKQYQLLSQSISEYGLKVLELGKSEIGVWTIDLDNGWRLLAGRTDIIKKVQRLMKILAQKKIDRQDQIKVIDMRYENGLAIQWKEAEQHARNNKSFLVDHKKQNI